MVTTHYDSTSPALHGRVASGVGAGASFTALDWARARFVAELGVDPHPGTLNLHLEDDAQLVAWRRLAATPGRRLLPDDPQWCAARGYPVRIAGRFHGAIVLPEVADYPETQLELICALPLREALRLGDGDPLHLEPLAPRPVRALVFDVDGVLLDAVSAYRHVANLVAEPLGFSITEAMVCDALNHQRPFWELIVPAAHAAREEVIAGLRSAAFAAWPEVLANHARLFPGLRAALDGWRGRGARLGIVTGSHLVDAHPLHGEGLLPLFGAVVTADDDVRTKPAPDGLLACLETLGVAPSEAAYIGDTPVDVAASHAAGMLAIGVLTGAGSAADLAGAGADWVLPSLHELDRAVRVRNASRQQG